MFWKIRIDKATIKNVTGVLISPWPDQKGNKFGRKPGTWGISTTSRRELSSRFFLQGKVPKEIQVILTETLDCFLPGRAKDLSAPLYYIIHFNNIGTRAVIEFLFLQGKVPKEIHAILIETLTCALPGRAKDLSAPLCVWLRYFLL